MTSDTSPKQYSTQDIRQVRLLPAFPLGVGLPKKKKMSGEATTGKKWEVGILFT